MAKKKYKKIEGVEYEIVGDRKYAIVDGSRWRIIGRVRDFTYHGFVGPNGEHINCPWDDGIPPEEKDEEEIRMEVGMDFLAEVSPE